MALIISLLRLLSVWIDKGLYGLAWFLYQVFCAIGTSTIIDSVEVESFARRIYVVVGVFTLFKVGIAMLKYLVNPDQLTDSKSGYNKIIWNITWALVLVVAVPSIYKFAMDVQGSILKSGIIPKIVLGQTSGEDSNYTEAGNTVVFTTFSAFVSPNYMLKDSAGNYVILKSETKKVDGEEVRDKTEEEGCFNTDDKGNILNDEGYSGMFVINDGKITGLTQECKNVFNRMTDAKHVTNYEKAYKDSDTMLLLDVVNDAALNDDVQKAAGVSSGLVGKIYFLTYTWGVSWLVGAFLCFIFTTFCIDLGIRSIKLAFLVLISPVPILSMINPEKGANGMLSKWWQVTWVTYLDIFLRMFSIFFVIFVIQQVDLTATIAKEFGPIVSAFAKVFIVIGALLFAKELPSLVSSLIPGMDSIMKGGFNPLKKLGEAANMASKAPLVGKGITGLSNRFATQHAMNKAAKDMEKANKKEMNKDFRSALDNINKSKTMSAADKKSAKDALREQHKKDKENFAKESAQRMKNQRELSKQAGKYAGAEAAAGVSLLGGESKPITSAGAAAAKIRKDSNEKIHNMQKAALQQRQAEANLTKVEDQAIAERNAEIAQKEGEIVAAQREAAIEREIQQNSEDYKNMTSEEARSAATRKVEEMEATKLKEQAVEKRKQAKMAQGMEESAATVAAKQEVNSMSSEAIAKEGNVSKAYSEAAGEAAKQQALSQHKSNEEAEAIGAKAAKESREAAEDKVVKSVSDRMDEVAARTGVIYKNEEYANGVRMAKEAKSVQKTIKSELDKATLQFQSEKKVTKADGTVLEGDAAIKYVNDLSRDYDKATGDYDFMSKQLDSLGEKYPDDAATRKGYEHAKDSRDKKKKFTIEYASKVSQVSDNEREGGQKTVAELLQEDTVANTVRRADAAFAATIPQIVTRQTNLQQRNELLEAKIADSKMAGNIEETVKLENELRVNNVELGRVEASLKAADIAKSNTITGLASDKNIIETNLKKLESDYQYLEDQKVQLTSSGAMNNSQVMQEFEIKQKDLESKMEALNAKNNEIDKELSSYGVDLSTLNVSQQPSVILDTRVDGVGNFDRIGSPIRAKVENIATQMEVAAQRMNNTELSNEERLKAKYAVESAKNEIEKALKEAGNSIYSGFTSEAQKQVYDKKLSDRIKNITDKTENS